MTIAGLWDEWRVPDTGELLRSCAMIIGQPNSFVAEIHDRMPIILERDQFEQWLRGETGLEILKPADDAVLDKCAVSRRVNSSKSSDEDHTLIEPVTFAALPQYYAI